MNIHKGTLAGLVMAVIMAALLINNAFNTQDLGCINEIPKDAVVVYT